MSTNLSTKSFVSQIQSIASGIIWKDQKTANKYEVNVSNREHVDYFMAANNGTLDFDSVLSIPSIVLSKVPGLTEHDIAVYSEDKDKIPSSKREIIMNVFRKVVIDNYREENDYYRMLNGLPPIEDEIYGNYIYNTKYRDVEMDVPIHLLPDIDKRKLENNGYIKELLQKYPNAKYLDYIYSKRVDIYLARSTEKFGIMKINTTITGNILEDFKTEYRRSKDYMIRVHYSDGFRKNNEYYDNFIAMAILFMTIQKMNTLYLETDITRDFYDLESIKTVYQSYGVPFYEEIPLSYHKKIIKKINKLISYRGSNQVLVDLCDLFDYGSMEIYNYFLVKRHKMDTNGNPLFVRKENGEYDKEKMYQISFVQVPIGDDPYSYVSDDSTHMDTDTITSSDPYWVKDEKLMTKLYESEYNYIESKYLGVRLYFDLMEIMYEEAYLFRYLFDKRNELSEYKVPYNPISRDISIYSLAIYLTCLLCKKSGYNAVIPSEPEQVACVLGFNFKANLKEVIEDIKNNENLDNDIVSRLVNMNIDSLDDVRIVFKNIKEMVDLINNHIYEAKNLRTFQAYKELRKTLLTTKMSKEVYLLSNGRIAPTFFDILEDVEPALYDRLENQLQGSYSSEIDYAIAALNKVITDAKNLQFVNDMSLETIINYLFKLLDFFKSAKVDLTAFNIVYTINSRSTELIKLFSENVSQSYERSFFDLVDLAYSDIINEWCYSDNKESTVTFYDLCVRAFKQQGANEIIRFLDSVTKEREEKPKDDLLLKETVTKVNNEYTKRDQIAFYISLYQEIRLLLIQESNVIISDMIEISKEISRNLLEPEIIREKVMEIFYKNPSDKITFIEKVTKSILANYSENIPLYERLSLIYHSYMISFEEFAFVDIINSTHRTNTIKEKMLLSDRLFPLETTN